MRLSAGSDDKAFFWLHFLLPPLSTIAPTSFISKPHYTQCGQTALQLLSLSTGVVWRSKV